MLFVMQLSLSQRSSYFKRFKISHFHRFPTDKIKAILNVKFKCDLLKTCCKQDPALSPDVSSAFTAAQVPFLPRAL